MSAMEQEIDGIKQEIHDQQIKEQELTFEAKRSQRPLAPGVQDQYR